MPMRGSRAARLHQVRLVDSYGARFWQITYTHDEAPEERRTARIGIESVYDDPQPGDRVLVSYIHNEPASIHKTD